MLEIGVFVGYSAMVWAHAVGPEGKVTGLEFSPDYAKKAEEAFKENGVGNAEVIVGDALETYVISPDHHPQTPLASPAPPPNAKLTTAQPHPAQAFRALRPHLHRRPEVGLPGLPVEHPRALAARVREPAPAPRRHHRRRQCAPPGHRGGRLGR